MAGRGRGRGRGSGRERESGRKRTRLLAAEQQPEAKLPEDILLEIISRVTLRDNIRASAVCKRWLETAISVRNVVKPPLVMIFPKKGNLYEFCDPSQRKSFSIELPELHHSEVCCAKDGWLLVQKLNAPVLFFFSPYTRDMIELPFKELRYGSSSVAFSAPPTSDNCIVTAIEDVDRKDVEVSMFRLRQSTEWTTITFEIGSQFITDQLNKLFFIKGLFYCFSNSGLYGIFDPDTATWAVHPMPRHPRTFFMAEHDGDFFAIFPKADENPEIYKLDCTKKVWSKRKTLGGITLFGNYMSSLCRTNLGKMRDKIYLSKVYYGKKCVSYSLDDGRYYPKDKLFDWDHAELVSNLWLEWPENPPIFR